MEGTARLLAEAHHGVLSGLPDQAGLRWSELLEILTLSAEFAEARLSLETYPVTKFLVDDPTNQGSILSCMAAVRENLRTIRERVPTELRGAVNDTYTELRTTDFDRELREEPQGLFARVSRASQTFLGITESTMSRNDNWRFLTLGRMTERALLMTRLIDVYFARLMGTSRPMVGHWSNLLRAAGALQEYRRVFQTSLDPVDAINFLVQDPEFPRSLLWCAKRSERQLNVMTTENSERADTGALKMMRELVGRLQAPTSDWLDGSPSSWLRSYAGDLEAFSDQVHAEFFADRG
jgi:uncharacterized alpha-E superfamily protein